MNPIRLLSILFFATFLAFNLAAQDDGLSEDDLFADDFDRESVVSINDPFEPVNRVIFSFNDGLYTHVAKPFANGYTAIMPDPVEKGVDNFFLNLKFPSRFVGNIMQGKLKRAGQETGRFLVNTTAGIGGLFDPASEMEGLDPPKEDIAQGLASWGIGHGFYIVIPFRGPTSLRDFAGDFADRAPEPIPQPWTLVDESTDRFYLQLVEVVNGLPSVMDLYDSMRRSAIDPYASVRDAYAQRRARMLEE